MRGDCFACDALIVSVLGMPGAAFKITFEGMTVDLKYDCTDLYQFLDTYTLRNISNDGTDFSKFISYHSLMNIGHNI